MMRAPATPAPARTRTARWTFAAKPASWPKLLVPCLLGQAIGLGAAQPPCWEGSAWALAFTVAELLLVVFLNDWSDREVDALKRRMFPNSSPKTIADGVLPAHHLLLAGLAAALAALALALLGWTWLGRPWLSLLGVGSVALFIGYSLPPLRLNYRGGGELLEMIGVGVWLPLLSAHAVGGSLGGAPGLWLLPGFTLLALASAVASGLSDERSDRAGGKRTFVGRFGNRAARRTVEALLFAGAILWAAPGVLGDALPRWVCLPAAAVAFWYGGAVVSISPRAGTDAFAGQREYKARLHRAIWRGGATAAMLLAWWHLTSTGR